VFTSPQTTSEKLTAMRYWRNPEMVGVGTPVTPQFQFTKLVDTATRIPGGHGHFLNFGLGHPSIFRTQVVFWGAGQDGQSGIYLADATGLKVIANSHMTLPDSADRFACFGSLPIFDQNNILFLGQDQTGRLRIYRDNHSRLMPLVGTDTGVLKPGETFINLSNPAAQNEKLVFLARVATDHRKGVFYYAQGHLQAIALVGAPDQPWLNVSRPAIDQSGQIVFKAETAGYQTALYCYPEHPLDHPRQLLATNTTPIPGGIGCFTFLGEPVIDQGRVVFRGGGAVGQQGIYQDGDQGLKTLVDSQTRVPNSLGTFARFSAFAVEGDDMVFLAQDSYERVGLFWATQQTVTKLIELGDKLDDKTIVSLSLSHSALHQQVLTFWARFVDGTEGIFRAERQG
jgi:hypothetical protein